MSNRYDPVDPVDSLDKTLPPVKAPLEPVNRRGAWLTVAAIAISAAIAVAAAFGFDLCQAAQSLGITFAACVK
jgi:hypothetical protein